MKKLISIVIAFFLIGNYTVYADTFDSINAKSLFLVETESGEILYEKNADERLPIASVTKIMTMLLIMEAIDSGKITFDDMVPVSERAMSMGGSTMFLEIGEELSVKDMLKGIAVASANDGAVAMAEYIAGSETAFVEMMNKKAEELGMKNTNFVNTNGLDAENHFSSARDVALMSKELMKHKKIFEYTTIWTDSLRDGKFQLANTNKLIRFYEGATGLKTGSTSEAKCCISATAQRDGMHLAAIVLSAQTSKERFSAAKELLDYGFANYTAEKMVESGEKVEYIDVNKGKETNLALTAEESCTIILPKGKKEIEQKKNIPVEITAPIKKGEQVGTIDFIVDGELKKSVKLLADKDIEKKSFTDFLCDAIRKLISC